MDYREILLDYILCDYLRACIGRAGCDSHVLQLYILRVPDIEAI